MRTPPNKTLIAFHKGKPGGVKLKKTQLHKKPWSERMEDHPLPLANAYYDDKKFANARKVN
jgi:hypothetical protein